MLLNSQIAKQPDTYKYKEHACQVYSYIRTTKVNTARSILLKTNPAFFLECKQLLTLLLH